MDEQEIRHWLGLPRRARIDNRAIEVLRHVPVPVTPDHELHGFTEYLKGIRSDYLSDDDIPIDYEISYKGHLALIGDPYVLDDDYEYQDQEDW